MEALIYVLGFLSKLTRIVGRTTSYLIGIFRKPIGNKYEPTSVNYHFTRECNYSCGFCFHTAKSSFVLSLEEAMTGLLLLKKAGMKKLNFAGGEPFLKPQFLGDLCKYAKEELHLESVTIVSNGSKIREEWMAKYGRYVDIIAISCDSFDEATNIKIGRGKGKHLESVMRVRQWCTDFDIKFKLNTVVNRHNWEEDMNTAISRLHPARWKVFQVLIIQGENDGENTKRNAQNLTISDQQFQNFLDRHRIQKSLVPEDNNKMRASYLILDEFMRFLDCSKGSKTPSASILNVGVEEAMKQTEFDRGMFIERGGVYDWARNTKENKSTCSGNGDSVDIEDLCK